MADTVLESTPLADSSPAPADTGQSVLNRLSPEQRQSWERTGEIPDLTPAAESSPAPSGTQTGETSPHAPPASETGTPAPKGAKLKARSTELDKDIADLNAKLAERARLRQQLGADTMPVQTPSPASSPGTGKPTLKAFTDQIGETYDSYEAAVEAFQDARDAFRESEQVRVTEQRAYQQEVQRVATTFSQQIADAELSNPEFRASIAPELWHLKPFVAEVPNDKGQMPSRTAQHDLAEAVMTSSHGPQLLQHLSAHQDVYRSILASPNPLAVYRAIGRIEASFSTSVPAEPPPPVKQDAAAVPPITKAPPPPVTLGKKPSEPEEAWRDAVARGDFSAYERTQNEAEWKSKTLR